MRSAVVSGATGLVGRATVRELTSQGFEVLALGRSQLSPAEVEVNFGSAVSYLDVEMSLIGDLQRRMRNETNFQGRECVFFHFAWSGKRGLTDGGLSVQLSNVKHATDVISVAKEIDCEKVIGSGTFQETLVEKFLNAEVSEISATQQDYAVAKLAARDMSKITSYLQKIDFVHTRMSVPLDFSLVRGTYIAQSLKAILRGVPYKPPVSNEIVDLVSTEDVGRAYVALGSSTVSSGDFYIGSSRPVRIPSLLSQFEEIVKGRAIDLEEEKSTALLFDTTPLKEAVGFAASRRIEDITRDWTGG